MKQTLFVFASLLLPIFLFTQEVNTIILDSTIQQEVLVGFCNRDGLKQGDFASFYFEEYENYQPDLTVINELAKAMRNYQITIVMATWCGDSKDQVPRFYKLLDALNYNDHDITLICVDRSKDAHMVDISNLSIELVPTFIVFINGKEKGRITESPINTLEDDLLHIVSNDR